MVSLQQIKKLENRVLKAVEMINNLRDENVSLRGRLQGYENKILELEEIVEKFKNEQKQIESGIIEAIQKLDVLEDSYNSKVSGEEAKKKTDSSNADLKKNTNPEKTGTPLKAADEDNADSAGNIKESSRQEEGVKEINDKNAEEELDIF